MWSKGKLFMSYNKFITALFALFCCTVHASNPLSFTYQGQLLAQDGVNPSSDTVDFTFQIYNPSATCLLYEQHETGLNFVAGGGVFTMQVGSTIGNALRGAN